MLVEINKEVLIAMIINSNLSFELYDHPEIMKFGRVIRKSRLDSEWMWDSDHRFIGCTENELLALYELIIGKKMTTL